VQPAGKAGLLDPEQMVRSAGSTPAACRKPSPQNAPRLKKSPKKIAENNEKPLDGPKNRKIDTFLFNRRRAGPCRNIVEIEVELCYHQT
jgi:hypothetical protein